MDINKFNKKVVNICNFAQELNYFFKHHKHMTHKEYIDIANRNNMGLED